MSDPEGRGFAPVADGQLYFERTGRGPAVVLIHSAFLDHRLWDAQMQSLATDHTVVRYDVRGHGRSTGPLPAASSVDDLTALLNHLEIRSAYLVGNSFGADIAAGFAAGFPDRTRGLVLVAGNPGDFPPTPEEEQRFLSSFPEGEGRLVEAVTAGRTDEAIDLMLELWAPRVAESARGWLREIVRENYAATAKFLRSEGAESPPRPAFPIADRLRSTPVPILSLSGAHDDPVVGMMMGRFAQQAPSARHFEVADGDHTLSVSARPDFERHLRDFLARVDGGQPWPPPHP